MQESVTRIHAAVTAVLEQVSDPDRVADEICRSLLRALPVDGVGISLMCDRPYRKLAGASDPTARALEEIQMATGEGPCVDATRHRRPVQVPDTVLGSAEHWPGFTDALQTHAPQVRAVFAYPLLLPQEPPAPLDPDEPWPPHLAATVPPPALGCLDLYRHSAGLLDATAHTLAKAAAEATAYALLHTLTARPNGSDLPAASASDSGWSLIHQAVGVIAARRRLTPADALAALRALAFSRGQLLPETAHQLLDEQPPTEA